MSNFNFTMETPKIGILSPDMLKFFYYDICRDSMDCLRGIYREDEKVKQFKKERGLVIESRSNGDIPEEIPVGHCYFTTSKGSTPEMDFFRHLRNAFAHFRIVNEGEEYVRMQDMKINQLTMNGFLKFQDLKEYCFLFFDQKTQFLERIENEEDRPV